IGDACDDDVDGDGVSNADDTCELYSNEDQSDGLDSPTSCCGVDCYAVAPGEGVSEMGCFQGVCAPSVCASTHYANPDGPTEGPGVECLKRSGPIWVHPFLGDDDNDGLSEEAPKETLQGAVDAAVEPYTLINLMADTFTVSEQVEIPADRTGLRIQGVDEGNKKARLTTSPPDATFPVMWIRASGVEVANLELRGGATAVHIQGAAEGEDGVTLEDVLLDQVVIEQQKPAAIDGVSTPTTGVYATDVKDLTLSDVEVREQEPETGTGAWATAVYIHDGKNTRIEGLNVQDVSISPGAADAAAHGVYLSDLVDTSVVDTGIWGVSADLEGAATGLVCHDCVKLTLDTVEVQGISSGVAADAQGVVLQNLAVSATLTGLNLWDITSADGDDTAELPPGGATGLALTTEEGFLAQSDVVIRDLQVRGVTAGEATEALSAAGTQGQARGLLVAAPALLKISQISISDITAALAADVTTGDHRARGVEIASAESVELEQGSLHDIGVYTDALLQDTGVGLLVSGPVSDPVGVQSTILSQIHGEGIRVDDEGSAVGLSYSLTWSVWAGLDPGLTLGDGVLLEMDPQFVDPETGDLHLASESPAIDAGAPSGAFEPNTPGPHFCHEPQHNGARVNMGYYGGTPEATVRPGATASAPEDCDPAPECAETYISPAEGEAPADAPCGCYDNGVGALGDPCFGSIGSCAGAVAGGQIVCGDGVLACSVDVASDADPEAYVGGDELCNLNDDDCDGEVDEV
ncbi:MAG: thrombospondin type 3 repeat-containing protein, partial [Myxococcota bacterium]|nr:thrombospondin type 3 repeat-containing protein [Myxococcota bacterium]